MVTSANASRLCSFLRKQWYPTAAFDLNTTHRPNEAALGLNRPISTRYWINCSHSESVAMFERGGRDVAYLRSGDLVWLAFVREVSIFASISFYSSIGSAIVDACTKVVVGRRELLQPDPSDDQVS
ncbi:hypothetical protein B296_00017859 [Ensete ventricosum]|uniref:Uncharacterized protein n=1 Tax=Ensete ventricosum TaxID=4639 RepID=A0A427A1R5_ENSVE|nr:hypothetical protein B296_00017859 [Ensete ventricosum]